MISAVKTTYTGIQRGLDIQLDKANADEAVHRCNIRLSFSNQMIEAAWNKIPNGSAVKVQFKEEDTRLLSVKRATLVACEEVVRVMPFFKQGWYQVHDPSGNYITLRIRPSERIFRAQVDFRDQKLQSRWAQLSPSDLLFVELKECHLCHEDYGFYASRFIATAFTKQASS